MFSNLFLRTSTKCCHSNKNIYKRFLSTIKSCDKNELKQFIKGNCIIIDVREKMEIAQTGPVHHKAINIPLMHYVTDEDGNENILLDRVDGDEFLDEYGIDKPNYDDHIIFTCKAGVRSNMAAQLTLQQNPNYKNIINYVGGADDWFN